MKRWTLIMLILAGGAFAQFADDFNAGTSENWTPKTPDRWTAGLEHGRRAFYINTGDYSHEAPARLGEYALVTGRIWSDFSFSCLARSREDFVENPSADFAVVFGYQNGANYYYMLFNRWAPETKLYKIVSGERTEIAAASGFWIPDNAYRIVEVRRSGNQIVVSYDGRLLIMAYDDTFDAGQIGVGSYNDAASFDDVRIGDLPLYYDRAIRQTPLAAPFSPHEPAGGKSGPVIDVTPDGSFVLAWMNFREIDYSIGQPYPCQNILAQAFMQNGSPLTAPLLLSTGLNAINPEIAAKDGRFFVSWFDIPDGYAVVDGPRSLVGRHYSLDGTPISDLQEFQSESENAWGAGIDHRARVAYRQGNQVVAVWGQWFILHEHDIYTNLTWSKVNESIGGTSKPTIAADTPGRCLVVWDQNGEIYAQAFAADGGRTGSNLRVTQAAGEARRNALSVNANGNAVITWTRDDGIYARRFHLSGTFLGDEIRIAEGTGLGVSDVSVNRRGNAWVVWEAASGDDSRIMGRILDAGGVLRGSPVLLDETRASANQPKCVYLESSLYLAYQDTSIVVAVSLMQNDPPNYAPHLTSARADTAWEDTPYRYIPEGVDPNGDAVTFSFADYPAWLSPEGAGLSGTPCQGDGDTSFVVIASDGALSDSARVVLTVIPVDDPPRFVSPDSVTAWTDSLFAYTARAVDEEDSVLTYAFLDYPAWMTPADSVISGIVPSGARDTSFTVIVSDGLWTDTLRVHVWIRTANRPPRIVNLSDFTFSEAEIHAILLDTCAVDDGPAALLTWTIRPENDTLSVILQDRTAFFSAPGWSGSTPVHFHVTDPDGASDSLTVTVTVRTESGTGRAGEGLPEAYSLSPVYPNPFNAGALIAFELPAPSECTLDVYNLKGERIERLFEGRREAGRHSLFWDASAAPSGTYLIRLRAEGFVGIRKCTLIK